MPGNLNMQPASEILLVDDDPASIAGLAAMLHKVGRLRFATSGEQALKLATEQAPDLIFLDFQMPGMNGLAVCKALKADPALADVPVIFLTSHDGPDVELAGLNAGAVDFISKPASPVLVPARAKTHLRLKHMADILRRNANTDGLTGIANRRMFDETLEKEWLRAQRQGSPISLLLVDVDHFKRYNDFYGHQAGDRCLKTIAGLLHDCAARPADLAARFGGEEFALLLPQTDREGAVIVATRLLESICVADLAHEASLVGSRVSASIGITSFDNQCTAWKTMARDPDLGGTLPWPPLADLLAASDAALYAAKAGGRNHACYLAADRTQHTDEIITVDPGCVRRNEMTGVH
jgi:diguanylate cyclase (GGDEF)-like protein